MERFEWIIIFVLSAFDFIMNMITRGKWEFIRGQERPVIKIK